MVCRAFHFSPGNSKMRRVEQCNWFPQTRFRFAFDANFHMGKTFILSPFIHFLCYCLYANEACWAIAELLESIISMKLIPLSSSSLSISLNGKRPGKTWKTFPLLLLKDAVLGAKNAHVLVGGTDNVLKWFSQAPRTCLLSRIWNVLGRNLSSNNWANFRISWVFLFPGSVVEQCNFCSKNGFNWAKELFSSGNYKTGSGFSLRISSHFSDLNLTFHFWHWMTTVMQNY